MLKIELKEAKLQLVDDYYKLKKSRAVYSWAGYAKEPEYEFIVEKFKTMLQSDTRRVLLAYEKEVCVGYIYFDHEADHFTTGIAVGDAYAGRGVGKSMFLQGIKILRSKSPHGVVRGWIFPENIGSIKVFESVGFVKNEDAQPKSVQIPLIETCGEQHCWELIF